MQNLIHNAFLDDLGTDFVALNAQGTPVGRAGTREALEQAHAGADVQILDAAELAKLTPTLAEAAIASLDGPFAAVVAQGVAPEAAPVAAEPAPVAEKADGSAFDHDHDGKVGGSAKSEPLADKAKTGKSAGTLGAKAKK
jgi:hypothetical protein